MTVFAQYKVEDPDIEDEDPTLFKFFTDSVTVTFTHPIRITLINKQNKHIGVGCSEEGQVRFQDDICSCSEITGDGGCETQFFNGGYTGANQPYVCRVEIQFKGESLPDGTPINVSLFRYGNDHPLNQK